MINDCYNDSATYKKFIIMLLPLMLHTHKYIINDNYKKYHWVLVLSVRAGVADWDKTVIFVKKKNPIHFEKENTK